MTGSAKSDRPSASTAAASPPTATEVPEPARRPGFLFYLGRVILTVLARTLYRPRVVGRENVPRTGPVILASNHLSFIDSIVIPVVAPRRVQFLAKSHYFEGTGPKGWVRRVFFGAIGAVGVSRGAGQAAKEALDLSRSIIEDGSAFAIYPEGTRSLDGRLYRGRTGIGFLALTTGAPVVPVGLIGTDALQPQGATLPRLGKITVAFGEPLDLSVHGPATSGKARRAATDEVMGAIQRLTGQVEAGIYNEAPPSGRIERLRRAVMHEERM